MQSPHMDRSGHASLRVIFDETVVSVPLDCGATWEDVALRLDEFSSERYGDPRFIDVKLGGVKLGGRTRADRSRRPS